MSDKNILLIDDDIDDTLLFVEAVNRVSKRAVCRTARNPLKALEELTDSDVIPDILFLDYNMPMVNGLEFVQRMQQIEHLKEMEVIILSTPPQEVMTAWFERNNIRVKYISKPSSMEELEEIIRELL